MESLRVNSSQAFTTKRSKALNKQELNSLSTYNKAAAGMLLITPQLIGHVYIPAVHGVEYLEIKVYQHPLPNSFDPNLPNNFHDYGIDISTWSGVNGGYPFLIDGGALKIGIPSIWVANSTRIMYFDGFGAQYFDLVAGSYFY